MAGERVRASVDVEALGELPGNFKWMGKHTRACCRPLVAATKARVKAGMDATMQPFGQGDNKPFSREYLEGKKPITMKRTGRMLKDLGIQKATRKYGHVGPRKLRYGFVQQANHKWVGLTKLYEIPAIREAVAAQVKAITTGEPAKKPAARGRRSAVP